MNFVYGHDQEWESQCQFLFSSSKWLFKRNITGKGPLLLLSLDGEWVSAIGIGVKLTDELWIFEPDLIVYGQFLIEQKKTWIYNCTNMLENTTSQLYSVVTGACYYKKNPAHFRYNLSLSQT